MRVNKSVTPTDVVRRAGVSRTTASYILDGRADQMRIAPASSPSVQHVVDERGYRLNRRAPNLPTTTTRTLVYDHVASGHFASSMLIGASVAVPRSDHLMAIGASQGDRELEDQLIQDMLDRQVDGIAWVRLVTSRVTVPELLLDQRVVLVNCVDEHGAFPAVLPDERPGGRTAADVLVDGEEPTAGAMTAPLRRAGITERVEQAEWPLAGVVPCSWGLRESQDMVHLWPMSGARPAASICLSDHVATGTHHPWESARSARPARCRSCRSTVRSSRRDSRPPVVSIEVGDRAIEELTSSTSPSTGTRCVSMSQTRGLSVRGRL